MLRIDIEEERVFDAQNLWDRWAVDGEPHDLVGTVGVIVDQVFDDRNRAAGAIGGNHQAGQCVGSNSLCFALTSRTFSGTDGGKRCLKFLRRNRRLLQGGGRRRDDGPGGGPLRRTPALLPQCQHRCGYRPPLRTSA